MRIDRPAPGEHLHDGPPSTPRLVATVMLLRGGTEYLEVLMVRRSPDAHFMGGAWVFPGGAVDPADGDGQPGLRSAARRELAEEAGILLNTGVQLVAFAHWITPAAVRTRFDTWFYLAQAPPDAQAVADGHEIVDARWISPAQGLAAQARGELFLVFPTIRQLQQLSAFDSASHLLRYAAEREVRPVQPRIIGEGDAARIVLDEADGDA
ncbi:MAG: NUDIX hydrolase [Solirubrobacteraceae bacterium]